MKLSIAFSMILAIMMFVLAIDAFRSHHILSGSIDVFLLAFNMFMIYEKCKILVRNKNNY